jgi:hypothetical protein
MARWFGHPCPFQKRDLPLLIMAAREREEARVRGRVWNVVQVAA